MKSHISCEKHKNQKPPAFCWRAAILRKAMAAALCLPRIDCNDLAPRRFRGAFVRQLTERIGADALRFFMVI